MSVALSVMGLRICFEMTPRLWGVRLARGSTVHGCDLVDQGPQFGFGE